MSTSAEIRGLGGMILWWGPAAAIVATGFAHVGPMWTTAVWTAALTVMGLGCLLNARRCGRVHCYFTGPFFLLIAAAVLCYGLGVLPLGPGGWSILGNVLLIGFLVLRFVPEYLWGRYRRRSGPQSNSSSQSSERQR